MCLEIEVLVTQIAGFVLDEAGKAGSQPVTLRRVSQVELLKLGRVLEWLEFSQPAATEHVSFGVLDHKVRAALWRQRIVRAQTHDFRVKIRRPGNVEPKRLEVLTGNGAYALVIRRGYRAHRYVVRCYSPLQSIQAFMIAMDARRETRTSSGSSTARVRISASNHLVRYCCQRGLADWQIPPRARRHPIKCPGKQRHQSRFVLTAPSAIELANCVFTSQLRRH